MKFISTRGVSDERVSAAQAIKQGLASDGGLDYFTRLFAVNQAIKNNKAVSDAVFAYYEADFCLQKTERIAVSGVLCVNCANRFFGYIILQCSS